MGLLRVDQILDTVISWVEEQRPVYNTIINQYYPVRSLSTFLGRRAAISMSSLPAIEVTAVSSEIGWHACRVQQESPSLEVDITVDNRNPEAAKRLSAALATLTVRVLASPVHLLPKIQGTRTHLYDALPTGIRYDMTAQNGEMAVTTVSYNCRYLEYLENRLFLPYLKIIPAPQFPPL